MRNTALALGNMDVPKQRVTIKLVRKVLQETWQESYGKSASFSSEFSFLLANEAEFMRAIRLTFTQNLLMVLSFLFCGSSVHGETITVEPLNTYAAADGREIVSDFYLSRSDGSSEIFSARFGDEVFEYSGSSAAPAVSSLPLVVETVPVGPGPGPGTTIPQGVGGLANSASLADWVPPDEEIQPLPPLLIYIGVVGGGTAVSAAACAAGWFIVRRTMLSDCERRGGRFISYDVGMCGVSSRSSLHCEDPLPDDGELPEVPPEDWLSFSSNHLPWNYWIDGYMLDLSIPSGY